MQVSEWGDIDAWICNAGISPIVAGPQRRTRRRRVIEVNLTGSFLGPRRWPGSWATADG